MFKFVHHVDCVVRNRDEMMAFLERTFGMKPVSSSERQGGRLKEAQYRVGQTLFRITEPPPVDLAIGAEGASRDAQFLAKNGPGVHHVALVVDNLSQVVQQLQDKGITVRRDSYHRSLRGYYTADIEPKDSLGFHFQLVEIEEPK